MAVVAIYTEWYELEVNPDNHRQFARKHTRSIRAILLGVDMDQNLFRWNTISDAVLRQPVPPQRRP